MRAHRASRLLEDKIKSLKQLSKITAGLRKRGKIVVFTNGCFDILHFGHAKYLQEAASLGDVLVVAVNSDSSIKKIKGKDRPIVDESNRLRLIAALGSVDFVILFSQDTPINVIKALKPSILVKGADWSKGNIVGGDFVAGCGGKVKTVGLVKGLSTTDLINKIAKKSRS
jgi:D-beta-D-heptose 7-phosphate kinase/D-beta-D-heptose 1-phosphate adenosyltransferase